MRKVTILLAAVLLPGCGAGGPGPDDTPHDARQVDACLDCASDTDSDPEAVPDPGVGTDLYQSPEPEAPDVTDAAGDEGAYPADSTDAAAEAEAAPPSPPRPRVTVNALPDTMNGKVPFTIHGGDPQPFRLRVPTGGFTVDVYLAAEGEAWPGDVMVKASVPARAGGVEPVPPGTDLRPLLECGHAPDPMGWPEEELLHTRCRIPEFALDPAEGVVFSAAFAGDGTWGEEDHVTVDVAVLPAHLDPFPMVDLWVVVLSLDRFAQEVVAMPDGTYDLLSAHVEAGNGEPDLDEALRLLGLLSSNEAFSDTVRAMFIESVRAQAYEVFGLDAAGHPTPDGAGLSLAFEGDPGAPDAASWTPDAGFSRIALGGDTEDPDSGYVGMAWIDPNNQGREDDASLYHGVFVTSIVRQALRHPMGAQILREISPLDGVPLGEYPGDENLLDPAFDATQAGDERLAYRQSIFKAILRFATMGVATTLCHEMGHSLGLVPNGPPPAGLFGGMDGLSFAVSDPGPWHIDTPGLNVMQTGKVTNYLEALSGHPRFEQLSMAYLRRRLVVGDP